MVATASSLRKVSDDGSIGFKVSPAACPAAVRLQANGDVAAAAAVSTLRKPRLETSGGVVKSAGIMRIVLVLGSERTIS
jgi:hypothetical protein